MDSGHAESVWTQGSVIVCYSYARIQNTMELGKSVKLQSTALFVQALSIVKLEIMEHSVCDRLLLVVDLSLLQLLSSNLKSDTESILVLESSLIIAGTNSTVQLPSPPQRLARSCSLILRDGRIFFLNEESSAVATIKGQRESYLLFNLFVLMSRFDSADLFLRSTKQLLNVLVTISLNDSIEVYRPPLNRQRLQLISIVYKAAKVTTKSGILGLAAWPGENFEGDLLPVTVCVSCAVTLDEYNSKRSNIFWSEAILYELSFRMNATMKFIQIASPPRLDPTMENKWDDWVNPLTDGSAAIATLQPYSRSRIKAFDYAVPVVSDYVTFITRKPHKANSSNPFYRLMSPLSGLVWLSSIIVIIALLVSMETVFYAHRGRLVGQSRSVKMFVRRHYQGRRRQNVHRFHHSPFVTLTELMKPLIGYGADDPVFYGRLRRDCNAKFQYGTWLLVSIVLGSAYQSQLTSHLVMPDYAVPPGTFSELANSDMSLYAVLWGGNIEADFRSLNTSYSDKLLRDVTELKYFEPDVSLLFVSA